MLLSIFLSVYYVDEIKKYFENTNIIIDYLDNRNMNYIDKKIYILASGFFALKKLDLPIHIIYSLVNELLNIIEN